MKLYLYCFSLSSLLTVFPDSADAQTYSNKGMAQRVESGGTEKYPYWGVYHKTPVSEIRAAKWMKNDTFISGWRNYSFIVRVIGL